MRVASGAQVFTAFRQGRVKGSTDSDDYLLKTNNKDNIFPLNSTHFYMIF